MQSLIKKTFPIALTLLATIAVASCDSAGKDLPTPYTDGLTLSLSYEGKNFLEDGIGEVTLRSATDGDTANFNVGSEAISLRFLGINTPESTAAVEPWGTKASSFTKKKLQNATKIVLINDFELHGQTDTAGNRHLGFVWYQPKANAPLRMLNLELVEQAYSKNFLFTESVIVPYLDAFTNAGKAAEATGRRVYGEDDPGYDYSDRVIDDITIRDLREDYEDYGIAEDGSSSGFQLRIRGLIVALVGDDMVLRDVTNPYPDGSYAGIYAFVGYNTGLASIVSVGQVVYFYARAAMYNGNVQLTDVKTRIFGASQPFMVEKQKNEHSFDYAPITVEPSELTSQSDLFPYLGKFVTTEVTVRNLTVGDVTPGGDIIREDPKETSYFRKDSSGNITVYAQVNDDVRLNLRASYQIVPRVVETRFEVGSTYRVSGYVTQYYGTYQLQIANGTVITDVTN